MSIEVAAVIIHGHRNRDNKVIGMILLKIACGQSHNSGTHNTAIRTVGTLFCGDVLILQDFGSPDGLPEAQRIASGAGIVNFDLVCAVVNGNFVDSVAVKVACGHFKERIKNGIVDFAGFVKCRNLTQDNISYNRFCVFTVGRNKLDNFKASRKIRTLSTGFHIKLRHSVLSAAGRAVCHRCFVGTGLVGVLA